MFISGTSTRSVAAQDLAEVLGEGIQVAQVDVGDR